MRIRIFISCIAVMVAINIGTMIYFNPKGIDHQKIIKLKQENIKLEHKNLQLDSLILKRQKINDSLLIAINENQLIIENLHYEIKEKINTINRMSDMELYLYFSNIRTDQKNH
ncbi:hypothetical protein U8527_06965 [Kordia algicida OT-1]|uniref:Uncharacterized protein n=1 Tax=Kordia algicida OT-1 TaxID=391587 RepID=A9E9K6_9FLAO|nr:hypothetical protein [Kordia algicida]EDP94681.1 hypothetical protein KAOT1_00355 [Kordia algicida OT-1]